MSEHTVLPGQTSQEDEDGDRTAQVSQQALDDLRLADRVERALCAAGHAALRAVEVRASAGVVILKGFVQSYYLKQFAQTAATAVPGVQQVSNDLEMIRPK